MREPALIFDFGNVVGYFDHGRAYESLAAKLGLEAELLKRRARAQGALELFREFECGRINPFDFAQQIMRIAGFNLPYEDFVQGWADIFWPDETVVALVPRLKARGYRMILGSNTNILHATHYRRQFAETLTHFDRLIFSYEVGCMKPDRRFYLACVEAAGVPAESCVFIDDAEENVQGALRAGLRALAYTDTEVLLAGLRDMGVEVDTEMKETRER